MNPSESEDRYKALLSNINAGIVVHGPDTKIILSNVRASEILGLSREQMAGTSALNPHWKFIDNELEKLPFEEFPVNRIISSNVVLKDQIFGIIKDEQGEIRWVIVNGLPVHHEDGSIKEVVISFVDITALRTTEARLKKSLEEKTILLKEVNHRIKNNIINIEGILSLQLAHAVEQETIDALKDSISRVQNMRVLYEMLTGSEDRNKRMSVREYLNVLVKNVTEPYSKSQSVTLDLNIDEVLLESEMVFTLGMIVNELITNSMKYAFNDSNYGVISISVMKQNQKIKLIYKDNGPGMPVNSKSEHSTGLGLMLIHVMAENLGAELKFMNENGAKLSLALEIE
jgi:PAS domain S-box-containing protein